MKAPETRLEKFVMSAHILVWILLAVHNFWYALGLYFILWAETYMRMRDIEQFLLEHQQELHKKKGGQ